MIIIVSLLYTKNLFLSKITFVKLTDDNLENCKLTIIPLMMEKTLIIKANKHF